MFYVSIPFPSGALPHAGYAEANSTHNKSQSPSHRGVGADQVQTAISPQAINVSIPFSGVLSRRIAHSAARLFASAAEAFLVVVERVLMRLGDDRQTHHRVAELIAVPSRQLLFLAYRRENLLLPF